MSGKGTILIFSANHEENQQTDWILYGPLIVYTLLKEAGFKVIYIQEFMTPDYEPIIREHARDLLFFGVSATTDQIPLSLKGIQVLKKIAPDVPVVWGGCHATLLPQETLQSPYADYVIPGKVKDNLVRFAKALQAGDRAEINTIPNVLTSSSPAANDPGAGIVDYRSDELVYPRIPFEDFDFSSLLTQNRVLNYMPSLGCPGSCGFCPWGEKHAWNRVSLERTLADIDYLIRTYDLSQLWFSDATLAPEKEFLLGIAEGILARKLNVTWRCFARIPEFDKLTAQEYADLDRSGLDAVFFGVESMNRTCQKILRKKNSPKRMEKVISMMGATRIKPYVSFLFAIPDAPLAHLEEDRQHLDLWQSLNPGVIYQVGFYVYYPGSHLAELVAARGFDVPRSLEAWGARYGKNRFKPTRDHHIPWFEADYNRAYVERFFEIFPDVHEDRKETSWNKSLKRYEQNPPLPAGAEGL
ncbi:MAG: cobalamin-dependent protein [Magnetococcales bacterium]|nr:cobalamin-dependent protein [Magnetococcales bacterium]